MKKSILVLGAAALLLSSCDLNRFPLDKMSEDTFFSNEAGLLAFSNAFYGDLSTGSSLYLDNCDNYFQMEQLLEARGARTIPSSGSGWSWSALRDYNTLIGNAQTQCTDAAVRDKYIAIARFFRAYFYFAKVKRFGDVPWIDEQLSTTDARLYAPRDSREVVMQHIIEDLDFAASKLAKTKSPYTVTAWTALALKSRVCLFEGTFRKYHGITQYDSEHDYKWYLNECAEASKQILSNSGYSNYNGGEPTTNYLTLFTTNTVQGSPIASDVIFARNYNATYSVIHNSNYQFTTSSMGRYGMTRKTMASYLMADGTRFTDIPGWKTMSFAEETQNRDPRLAQSIRTPGYHRLDDTTRIAPNLSQTMTGYQPIKYVTVVLQDAYDKSDIDLILFRTAEISLNYAEAKAELGTISQEDLDFSINKVRARVGLPGLQMSVTEDPFLTDPVWGGYQNVTGAQKALILEIRRERNVELNQEGFRYYDLIRWKEGKILEKPMYGMYFPSVGSYDLDGNGTEDVILVAEGATKPSSQTAVVLELEKDVVLSEGTSGMIQPFKHADPCNWTETKDYLYPIPTDELVLNKNLTQNPGWE